jgi:hypothetical protein
VKHTLAVTSKQRCIPGAIHVIVSRTIIPRCRLVFMINPKLTILGSGQDTSGMSLVGSALSAATDTFAHPCEERLMLYDYLRALRQYPMHATYRMYTLSPPTRLSSCGPHVQHCIASFYAITVLLSFNYGAQGPQESDEVQGLPYFEHSYPTRHPNCFLVIQ